MGHLFGPRKSRENGTIWVTGRAAVDARCSGRHNRGSPEELFAPCGICRERAAELMMEGAIASSSRSDETK